MKDFFKYMFATIVGIIITSILLLLLFFGIIGAMVAKTDQTVVVKSNSLLIINLNQEIIDRGSKNPIGSFDFMNFKPVPQLGLNDILKAIDNAAQDENIRGIFIETESIPAGAATLEEIRMALVKFKESGKFIISYSDVYGQKSYYLSSVSDKILLNPEGAIEWVGMRGEIMFFKDALQKLGVEVQIIRHGKFKSAIEPFILDKMSPENREQTLTYMGSIWNHWVNGISKARNISVDELNKLADNLTISNAKSAVKFGLADSLVYKDQVIDMLKELTDTKPEKDINSVSLAQYTKVKPTSKHKGFIKDKIAVVYASGSIITGDGEEGSIASERFG
ncbi:MAG: S49 family peptidase, partial [Bacteroidales bacterium]|nr:S49 family peptidase [Bacteroidales bacterium]